MTGPSSFDLPDTPVSNAQRQLAALQRRAQHLLDLSMPYTLPRWVSVAVLLIGFLARILVVQGWYIVTYALGIYLLQLLLLFLSPKLDPALDVLADDDDDDVPLADLEHSRGGNSPASFLPTRSDEEFRPFIRRLPEFKAWVNAMRAILLAWFCSFFSVFDIPVFWPILVIYFFVLFAVTMRRQIRHMIKYRYLPFNIGKRRYAPAPGMAR
ncbi:hypothetical protein AMAG_16839 [Allomyces macrogynus ATCC 38327]|uniref:Protein RER1 n=1 Tax=Allomyces macrogynus (strain ATCC 38327) TaxID=578462 RepID=A0A0L0TCB3_ALLM3|nr:hypothetical protein AMAG_16839 [Allomyces macrogynus ATCC 38327]|eukprot:KNE72355.1 hypothetical protein AMAG_16839 [Allomyces macrogynus ATCC 38327]